MDHALRMLGGSRGRLQIIACACLVILQQVGNQFFYSMPFYQLYPKLQCFDKVGNILSDDLSATHCTRILACDKRAVDHFRIDWENDNSLHNWMTQKDLICKEPYQIGFIGSVSFISLSIGSFVFSKTIDQYGRKFVVICTGLTALLGISILQIAGDIAGLNIIYAMVFLTGSVYITRQSACYLYAVELMESKDKMMFSTIAFTFSGIL